MSVYLFITLEKFLSFYPRLIGVCLYGFGVSYIFRKAFFSPRFKNSSLEATGIHLGYK